MRPFHLLGLVSVLLLSACSGPVLGNHELRGDGIESFYRYGAGGRELQLEVRGNPFGGAIADADFAGAVEAQIQGRGWLQPPTHPRLSPGPGARPEYRLAFLFSPPITADGAAVCGRRAQAQGPTSGSVEVEAAFCLGDMVLSAVRGHVGDVSRPGDRRFQALMSQVMLALFPADRREEPLEALLPGR